jgi:hypothetical protein
MNVKINQYLVLWRHNIINKILFVGLGLSFMWAPSFGQNVESVLGVAHAGGKYWHLGGDYLNEGAYQIETLGSRTMKVFMGKNYASSHYTWNSTWPTVNDLKGLAQTAYFDTLYKRPNLDTFIIDATEFVNSNGTVKWKDGMTAAELDAIYDEMYAFVKYLRENFSGKTFIVQNWEGDNAYGTPADPILADQGMIDWLNCRQAAIDQAKTDTPSSTSEVWGAAEFNWLPQPFMLTNKSHYVLHSVIPSTQMDLYSLSNYMTEKNDGREDDIYAILNYMDSYCPDSSAFGNKNLYFGEFGSKENQLGQGLPLEQKENLQRQIAGRQIEQALKWGAQYIVFWAIYDNVLQDGVTLDPGEEAENSELLGNWLIRPDGSYPQIYSFFEAICGRDLSSYATVYELENQRMGAITADDVLVLQEAGGASGAHYDRFDADDRYDNVDYEVYIPEAGTYSISVGYQTASDAGTFQFWASGVKVGAAVDCYSGAGSNFTETLLSQTYTFGSAGLKNLKFKLASKNELSTGDKLYLDYLKLQKQ